MDDSAIIELYLARDEGALRETQTKYGGYLYTIAMNILAENEDSEECVNDTYMRAWQTIPPTIPTSLRAYLGTVVRNLAITVFRRRGNLSNAASQYSLSLDELEECISGGETPPEKAEAKLLGQCISAYLRTLSVQTRDIFVCRYYFCDPIKDIAGYFGASETKIKSSLFRTRKGLREYLKKEGFEV